MSSPRPALRLSPASRAVLWAAAAATAVAGLLSTRLDALDRRTLLPPPGDAAPVVGRHAARLLALGYTDFAADLAWIQALLYYGSSFYRGSSMAFLDHHIETTITLDPSFRHVYEWAGVVTMYNNARITNRSIEDSTFFLKRGHERFPDYWEFPFMIGCNYYFEMQTKDPDQKKAWQRIGSEYFRKASLLDGAPGWVALLAVSSLDKLTERRIAILHLQELLDQTEDPKLRRELEQRLTILEEAVTARERLRFGAALRRAHARDYPYLPGPLYNLLGAFGDDPHRTVRATWDAVTAPPSADDTPR